MPYNGVGTFTSLGAPTFPAVPNTYILASYFNATINDIFTGLSSVMPRDGQAAATANWSMGGFKLTNVGNGSAATDAVNYGQVFSSPTIANPTFTGTPIAPTAPPGTSTTQLATTAFVMAQAFNSALPAQTGNAGKFVTTDGNTASWGSLKTVGLNSISGSGDIPLNAPAQVVNALVHQAISGQCLALANTTAQPSATNRLLYSDKFSNGAWVKGSTIISTDVSTGPNGEATVEKAVESATTDVHYMYQEAIATPANVAHTLSFYAKDAGRSTFEVRMDRDSNGIDIIIGTFNLSTGTVYWLTNAGTASGAAGSIVHVGDGWYFCTLSGTCSTSAGTLVRALVYINTSSSYTGDGVSGIKFSGMQLEDGSSASSRIPTTSATVTRSAGVVAPQRIVLPASPGADAWVKPVVANGVATNVIDPNGRQFKGANGIVSGPIELDNIGFSGALQFINGYWRFV